MYFFTFSYFQIAPWDPDLRMMRADCHKQMGDYISAISDIKWVLTTEAMQLHSYSLPAFLDIITNNGKLYNIFHFIYFFPFFYQAYYKVNKW